MKHCNFLICLFCLLIVSTVFAATVTVDNPSSDGNYLVGTQGIIFSVFGFAGELDINATIYYSTSQGGRENVIVSDLNLDATYCTGFDFVTGESCTYSWDTIAISDGNYFIDVNVVRGSDEAGDSSDNDFGIDNNPPVTTNPNGKLNNWQNDSFFIDLSCSDGSGSGCTTTQYNLDGGGWSAYETEVAITTDGNHTFDYNSTDAAGNVETTKEAFALLDKNDKPTITIGLPANGSSAEDQTVSFDVNDSLSGINLSSIVVDINGTASTVFNASSHCTAFDGNYFCSYEETAFDLDSSDYNVTIFVSDNAGNAADQAASIFTYLDNTKPSQVIGLTPSAGDGQVSLSWTANTESDLSHYNIYRSTTSGSGFSSIATSTANSYTNTGLSNGTTYYFKVSAIDRSGNEGDMSAEQSAIPITSTTPATPTINSDTHPEEDGWYANDNPHFTWDEASGATGYSCTLDQSSGTDPGTSVSSECDRDITYSNKDNGTWYFHLRACNGSNCSETVHYQINIDTETPDQVTGLTASARSNGTVYLDWDSSSDSVSGVSYYKVYRSRSSTFDPDTRTYDFSTNDTDYTDEDPDLTDGVTYYYRVAAFDRAGNQGEYSSIKSATVIRSSGVSLSFDVDEYVGLGTLNIVLTSSGGNMFKMYVKIRQCPDGECSGQGFTTLASNQNNTNRIATTYDFDEEDEGEWQLYAMGEDNSSNRIETAVQFTVDGTAPELGIVAPEEGAEVSGEVELKASASDSVSGVKHVEFYLKGTGDWEKLATVSSGTDGNYVYSWDTNSVADGNYQLKAVAEDNASNSAEEVINISVANNTLPSGEEEYGSKTYEYDEDKIEEMLREAGLAEELIEGAMEMIDKLEPERELVITKMEDNYYVKIIIRFVNNLDDKMDCQVIEVIPKEFVEYADKIESESDIEVIVEDPIIKFAIEDIEEGEEIEIVYELSGSITKSRADRLLDSFDEFASLPIILDKEEVLGGSFKEKEEGGGITSGFFTLIGSGTGVLEMIGSNTLLVIGGVIVILVVIIIILIMAGSGFVVRERMNGSGRSEPEIEGLHTAIKQTEGEGGIFQRLGEAFRSEEKEKTGKFAWKEK